MNIKKAKELLNEHMGHTQNIKTGRCFNPLCIEVITFLEAVEQHAPLVTALKALATGCCEKKGCSIVAKGVLKDYERNVRGE